MKRLMLLLVVTVGVLGGAIGQAGAANKAAHSLTRGICVSRYSALGPQGGWANLAMGPDGNLWMTASWPPRIGRLTPAGRLTVFAHRFSLKELDGIVAGPDGNLWFTESFRGDRIGRITPTGAVTEFSHGITYDAAITGITAGPDGNLWFTEFTANQIGRITPAGVVTEYSSGISPSADLGSIASGPDGNLWFTESGNNQIGQITPSGSVTEFSSGISSAADPEVIAPGPDGNMWFGEANWSKLGRITPSGVVTEFTLPTLRHGFNETVGDLVTGPDGNLWFTESNNTFGLGPDQPPPWGRVGEITPTGQIKVFSEPFGPDSTPGALILGPGDDLWFTDSGSVGRITLGGPCLPLRVASRTAVVRHRAAQVRLRCGAGAGTCLGTLSLTVRRSGRGGRRQTRILAARNYLIAAGHTQRIGLILDPLGQRLLARNHGTLRVQAQAAGRQRPLSLTS